MTDNVSTRRSNVPHNLKKPKNQQKWNSVAYSAADDNDADVLVEDQVNRGPAQRKKPNVPSGRAAAPKSVARPTHPNQNRLRAKGPAEPIERVRTTIISGVRVMVLLRGLPGSGKSHLAQHLLNTTVPSVQCETFIFSTDDYFVRNCNGTYNFIPTLLSEAHGWNQQRVFTAAERGVSPIIVDNTHTQSWEMRPYLFAAVKYGYILETLEPNTPWAFNVSELARRNKHSVPRQKISDMQQRYEHNLTGTALLNLYNAQYPPNMRPPQRRVIPPLAQVKTGKKKQRLRKEKLRELGSRTGPENVTSPLPEHLLGPDELQLSDDTWDSDNDGTWEDLTPSSGDQYDLLSSDTTDTMEYVLVNPDNTLVYQKAHRISNATVEDDSQDLINFNDSENNKAMDDTNAVLLNELFWSGPSRETSDEDTIFKRLQDGLKSFSLNTDNKTKQPAEQLVFPELDFGKIDSANKWNVESWILDTNTATHSRRKYSTELLQQMESQEASTNTSSLDFIQLTKENCSDDLKILYGTSRDIAGDVQIRKTVVPPLKLMLDKGTTTTVEMGMGTSDIGSKSQHLKTLLNLFPQVQPDVLQDIFDKCQGDVNWAVDLLLECNQELTTEEPKTEQAMSECACSSEYEVHPLVDSISDGPVTQESKGSNDLQVHEHETSSKTPKHKNTNSSDPLKRYIEGQVKIGDEHYSEYLLNVRRRRHGESYSEEVLPTDAEQREHETVVEELDEGEDTSSEEELVELTLGTELVQQLEEQFGRAGGEYPSGFQPVVQLPASMARQLHALWLQSVCTQWRAHSSILQEIERQDRELALLLQQREQETDTETVPPRQPSLQEIMDMEIALAVYRADQQQWRNETPDDLASRMTRQKLFDEFPELDRSVLTEILQAHDNSFESTVQALLCSLDRTECTTLVCVDGRLQPRDDGGERLTRQLESAKHDPPPTLEWADQCAASDTDTGRMTAAEYREQAAHHLTMRQRLLAKASECAHKGMPQVAAYYSEVARLHMDKYEVANGRAACAFLSEHQSEQQGKGGGAAARTLDLHFLYVREAEQALALFLDNQISRLKQTGRPHDTVFIITGRGNRSAGGVSQLKPAIKRRLRERRLGYVEMNPGLLRVLLTKHSVLTNDLKNIKA